MKPNTTGLRHLYLGCGGAMNAVVDTNNINGLVSIAYDDLVRTLVRSNTLCSVRSLLFLPLPLVDASAMVS